MSGDVTGFVFVSALALAAISFAVSIVLQILDRRDAARFDREEAALKGDVDGENYDADDPADWWKTKSGREESGNTKD